MLKEVLFYSWMILIICSGIYIFEGLVINPSSGFCLGDPFWYGVNDTATNLVSGNISVELGTPINFTTNLTGATTTCVDIDHPNYGDNYTCGTPNANFTLNISYFRKTELNDSSTSKNISWVNGGNDTVYIKGHHYDEIENVSINVSGYISNGTYPTNVKIYVNNTLSNNVGLVFDGEIALDELNDGSTIKNITFDKAETNIEYLKIPKTASVSSAYMNLSGFTYDYGYKANFPGSNFYQIGPGNPTWHVFNFKPTASGWSSKIGFFTRGGDDCGSTEALYIIKEGDNVIIDWNTFTPTTGGTQQIANETISDTFFNSELDYTVQFKSTSCFWLQYMNGVTYYKTSVDSAGMYIYLDERYLNNISLEVGIVDGTYEWNHTGEFNETFSPNKTSNFNSSINTFLSTCALDSDGYCLVPLYFISDTAGKIQISDIEVNYSYDPNPVYLDKDLINSFLESQTNYGDIPIKFQSSKNGTLVISDIRYDYLGGNDTIEVLVYEHSDIDCYQETANISTDCGGLGTGAYLISGAWTSAENIYDGNWGTFGSAQSSSTSFVFFNYTKPYGALNSSLWQVKDKIGSENLTIAQQCFNQNPLQFRINSSYLGYTKWGCWNGTDYILLRDATGVNAQYVYEESMIWDILYTNKSNNETLSVFAYYSSFFKNLPYTWASKLFFIPKTNSSKNVTAYGQTTTIPAYNITTTNYGGDMNLSIKLNEDFECLNLTWSNNATKNESNVINTSWQTINSNVEYLNNTKLWLWADFENCNASDQRILQPSLEIEGYCVDCEWI